MEVHTSGECMIVNLRMTGQETGLRLIPDKRPNDPWRFLEQHMDLADTEASGTSIPYRELSKADRGV
jgi:hypothetical protein